MYRKLYIYPVDSQIYNVYNYKLIHSIIVGLNLRYKIILFQRTLIECIQCIPLVYMFRTIGIYQ